MAEYLQNKNLLLSTKANTLRALEPLLRRSYIEPLLVFTESDWKKNKKAVVLKVKKKFKPNIIIVRSSALCEDTKKESKAGFFKSVLWVNSDNEIEIKAAIDSVVMSYINKNFSNPNNQIIIQRQAINIAISGVVFTRSLENNAPYYVINYDDSSGLTDRVTAGLESKKIFVLKESGARFKNSKFNNLVASIKEIEDLFPDVGLDVEFAINKKGRVTIFQVRPIVSRGKSVEDKEIYKRVSLMKQQLSRLSERKAHLSGSRTIFGDMPDWNPAEVIGNNPNILDYSIYDCVITNSVWHKARKLQGYSDVAPAKLVHIFGNKPYVDVRSSFNSFIPNGVPKRIKEKLISFYFNKLEKNPHMQDKVEFDIVLTCYDFCLEDRIKELLKNGFSVVEASKVKDNLINITNKLIAQSDRTIKKDLESLAKLDITRRKIARASKNTPLTCDQAIDNINTLFHECGRNGTLQFSKLARLAFVGKIILKSLVRKKIISKSFFDNYLNSINTVATTMGDDYRLLSLGKLSKKQFISKYYHLRPGTYDITSPRYGSKPDLFSPRLNKEINENTRINFTVNKKIYNSIDRLLKRDALVFSADRLLKFVKAALEAREYSKFEFSKNLSDGIECIASLGSELGFSRQDMAMLHLDDILEVRGLSTRKIKKIWGDKIGINKVKRKINDKITLPSIIFCENDFDVVSDYIPSPNFITRKKVDGSLVRIGGGINSNSLDLSGKIVLVENGDPGYDWIFTRNPGGLITKYGGVASHMSIRCAELSIPAAIGCGSLYEDIKRSSHVLLDCDKKKISIIK